PERDEKGGSGRPGPGSVSRRPEYQNPCRHRSARASRPTDRLASQRNDITFAHNLIDGIQTDAILADKGYDADNLASRIAENGTEVVIPLKSIHKVKRSYDTDIYKERNRIERFFSKLKRFRRVPHVTTYFSPTSWASSNSRQSPS